MNSSEYSNAIVLKVENIDKTEVCKIVKVEGVSRHDVNMVRLELT